MRLFFLMAVVPTFLLSAGECNNKAEGQKFKGRFEIAGICMNYTIALIGGDPGKDAVDSIWTDEVTKKVYKNVFKLANPCNFPTTIKPGEEFYFVIDNTPQESCVACLAYYPTPTRALSIKVVK